MGRWSILSRRASAPEAPEVGDLPVGDAPRSRRDALRLAAVGIAGGVGGAVVSAGPARAADGSNVVVGSRNVSSNNNTVTTVEANGAGAAYALATDPNLNPFPAGLLALGNAGGDGLRGVSTGDLGYGVVGLGDTGYGVVGRSGAGISLYAAGTGRLLQDLSPWTGAPKAANGTFFEGETVRDANGDMWICTADGNPGSWSRVAAVPSNARGGATALLPTPFRLLDTRPGTSAADGTKGARTNGQVTTITATGRSFNGLQTVPRGAYGIVGNLTVTGPSSGGHVSVFPADSGVPNTSNLNFAAGSTIANAVTVGLSSGGQLKIRVVGGPTHVILDVAGYLS